MIFRFSARNIIDVDTFILRDDVTIVSIVFGPLTDKNQLTNRYESIDYYSVFYKRKIVRKEQ